MDDAWIDEFYRLIGEPHEPGGTTDHVGRAFELKNRNIPRFLYRYRKPNQYSLRELEQDSVYYCTPEVQNDPFDSLLSVSISRIVQVLRRKHLPKLLGNPDIVGSLSEQQIEQCKLADDPISALLDVYNSTLSDEKRSEMLRLRQAMNEIWESEVGKLFAALVLIINRMH